MSRIFKGDTDVSHTDGWIGSVNAYRLLEVLDQWHEAHRADWNRGYVNMSPESQETYGKHFDQREEKHAHVGAKYVRLDTGTSGAWMLDASTGDIFSIKAYGQVDRKKCAGNINNPAFNGEVLFRDRFRRGRFDAIMKKSDREILTQGAATRLGLCPEDGRKACWSIELKGEEQRAPRIVIVSALCSAPSAMREALKQREHEQASLYKTIFREKE